MTHGPRQVACVLLFMTSQEGALVAEEHVAESAVTVIADMLYVSRRAREVSVPCQVDFKTREKKLLQSALKVRTMPDGPEKVRLKKGILMAAKTLKKAEQAAKQGKNEAAAPVKDLEVEQSTATSAKHKEASPAGKVTPDRSHEIPSKDFKGREKLLMANALKIRTMPDGAEKTKFKQEIVASAKQLKKEEEAAKHAKQTKNTGLPHMHMDKFGHMLADPAPLPVQVT